MNMWMKQESTEEINNTRSLYGHLLENRIILLNGQIDDTVAVDIVAQLLYLDAMDPTKDIYLYINSPGGVITSGLSIFDTMNLLSADVSTVCFGQAASMGAFLLASGAKGKRYALPSSRIMIHQPLGGSQGQATDIEIQAREILRMKEYLNEILADSTGRTKDEIQKDTERDNFMTVNDAINYGIVDQVMKKRTVTKKY